MSTKMGLNVYSEIGRLKKVLIHRPGKEIENLTPDLMDRLLFDDIPYLKVAQEEHDVFAQVLRDNGAEVLYLEDMAAEALVDAEVKSAFIAEYVHESGIFSDKKRDLIADYLHGFSSNKAMVDKMMEGIQKDDVADYRIKSLGDLVDSDYPFIVDPMPNLYFTRDPFATIGHGVSLNHMRTVTRNRETLFSKYIFNHHKDFEGVELPFWYRREEKGSIEGGDELVLSDKILAIGISERTDAVAVEKIAKRLFDAGESFEVILAFNIPKKRAFMHLDTVFTMVDYDKFTIHPEIEGPLNVFSITRSEEPGKVQIVEETMELEDILKKYLALDQVHLLRCGNGNVIDAGREQWNDGSNTLAIAPGEVVVYARNHVTNALLEEHGIKLHVIPSSELSRGRGGPRCMSMPLFRENLPAK